MATLPPITAQPTTSPATGGSTGYRPEVWNQPALIMVTGTLPQASSSSSTGSQGQAFTYVFDAVFRNEHDQSMTPTKHPVQTGANITDHVFVNPATLNMEIGMSDVMDSFTAGMWGAAGSSKSVSAYQKLLTLELARVAVTIQTRLNTYQSMVLVQLKPVEDYKTRHSLRCMIRWEQIFVASITNVGHSTQPQTTDSTNQGDAQPGATPPGVNDQNILPPGSGLAPGISVNGSQSPSGAASSNPVADDPTLGS